MHLKSRLGIAAIAACFGLAGPASKVTAADASEAAKPGQAVLSSNPLSGNADAIGAGKKVFITWCAQCHGTDPPAASTAPT